MYNYLVTLTYTNIYKGTFNNYCLLRLNAALKNREFSGIAQAWERCIVV